MYVALREKKKKNNILFVI